MAKQKEEVIEFLKPRDAVRKRYGMYIGSNENANVIFREIIDNSCDELSAGFGNRILVSNNLGGYCFVADNGRGIPISYSKDKPGVTQAYLSISELHSGSKFDSTDFGRVGMNGVGSACANFLSSEYWLLSRIGEHNWNTSIPKVKDVWETAGPRSRGDLYYVIKCKEGNLVLETAGRLKEIEKLIWGKTRNRPSIPAENSTIVLFKPDPKIFEGTEAEVPIRNLQYFLLIQEKFYRRKINVEVDGISIKNTFKPYKYEILRTITPKDTSLNQKVSVYFTFEVDPGLGPKSEIGSVNGLDVNQGQHIQIAESIFKTALKEYYKIKHDCLLNGLQLCIIILAGEVVFDSQTKARLKSISKVKASDFVELAKDIIKIFKKDSAYWDLHAQKLNKLAESMKSIGAADKAQKFIDANSGVSMYRSKADLPKGFADATSKDRKDCELFIVEGLSAGGSLIAGRKDTRTHAIMPLKGKILNVTDKSVDRALESKVINDTFNIIGLGLDVNWVGKDATNYEEAHQIIQKRSRYGKIIIATDSDPDGDSIFNEIIYLFSKFARFLIDHGMVYRALSPLFRGYSKKTGLLTYYYPDDAFDPQTTLPVDLNTKKHFVRWKGLGSLSPKTGEVYDSFFNPQTRRLILVTPEGIEYSRDLNENINSRKALLYNKGVLSNPYNFNDL